MWRVALALLALALGHGLAPSASHADPPASNAIVVRPFDGPGSPVVRRHVVRVLSRHASERLLPNDELEAAARAEGVSLDDAQAHRTLAAELGIAAFVEGRVERGRRGWRVTVRLRNGGDGRAERVGRYTGRSSGVVARRLRAGLWEELAPALERAGPPAQGEPQRFEAEDDLERTKGTSTQDPVETEPREPDSSRSEPPSDRPVALDLAAGLRGSSRRLRFVDDALGTLPGYRLGFAPLVRIDGRWFPGAHVTSGALAHLGVDFAFEHALALGSRSEEGDGYDTKAFEGRIGLRGRLPLGPHAVSAFAGWGRHAFRLERAEPAGPRNADQGIAVPSTDYRFVRFGAHTRLEADRLAIEAALAWRHVLDPGGIGTGRWFPDLDVAGFDARVTIGYRVSGALEVRLGANVRRYFYTMHPEPGDAPVAGGAVDQYVGTTLSLAWRR